jgi:hypothetical protein
MIWSRQVTRILHRILFAALAFAIGLCLGCGGSSATIPQGPDPDKVFGLDKDKSGGKVKKPTPPAMPDRSNIQK